MKKVLVPLVVILIIMVVALVPIIQNIKLSNSLLDNGYDSPAGSNNIFSSWYSKSDGEDYLFSYYLDYSLLGSGVSFYTRSSDEVQLRYDGKTIRFDRSACQMVKENDEFIMADDSSTNCKRIQPSDELVNKVVSEYNVINNIE
jgi:hypothetical protein